MGYSNKYGKVSTEHGDIPDDEPVFVLRARDATSLDMLAYYLMRCVKKGSPKRHLDIVNGDVELFRAWQQAHEVRVPASEGSRAWLPE